MSVFFGSRFAGSVGSVVRSFRPIARSAGLTAVGLVAVVRYDNSARNGSSCCRMRLAICTARSACPFDQKSLI